MPSRSLRARFTKDGGTPSADRLFPCNATEAALGGNLALRFSMAKTCLGKAYGDLVSTNWRLPPQSEPFSWRGWYGASFLGAVAVRCSAACAPGENPRGAE